MSQIKKSALELIGGTPIIELSRYAEVSGIKDVILLGKLESFNSAGSVKDRIALAMIYESQPNYFS